MAQDPRPALQNHTDLGPGFENIAAIFCFDAARSIAVKLSGH